MQDLVDYLRQHVPLTRHIDIHAGRINQQWFELCAPLTPNLNDKRTAFGGTLATLCTLSGWCVASLLCREASLKVDIAVTDSHIRYRLPVTSDPIAARAFFPKVAEADNFIKHLNAHGAARLSLRAELRTANKTAVSFEGEYYARLIA